MPHGNDPKHMSKLVALTENNHLYLYDLILDEIVQHDVQNDILNHVKVRFNTIYSTLIVSTISSINKQYKMFYLLAVKQVLSMLDYLYPQKEEEQYSRIIPEQITISPNVELPQK